MDYDENIRRFGKALETLEGEKIHPQLREMLANWMAEFSHRLQQAIDSNFYDKGTQETIKLLFKNLLSHYEYVKGGQVRPNWAYMFFLFAGLSSILAMYLYPPEPPPQHATTQELAYYFLHPACPYKKQNRLCDDYNNRNPAEFNREYKILEADVKDFGYLAAGIRHKLK